MPSWISSNHVGYSVRRATRHVSGKKSRLPTPLNRQRRPSRKRTTARSMPQGDSFGWQPMPHRPNRSRSDLAHSHGQSRSTHPQNGSPQTPWPNPSRNLFPNPHLPSNNVVRQCHRRPNVPRPAAFPRVATHVAASSCRGGPHREDLSPKSPMHHAILLSQKQRCPTSIPAGSRRQTSHRHPNCVASTISST